MPMVKVLNISSGDLVGSRFNGFDWHYKFEQLGIDSKLLVSWNHHSKEKWVDVLSRDFENKTDRDIARLTYLAAQEKGKEDSKFYWSRQIFEHPFYKDADVVHLQIVQDGTLDLGTIKKIISEKPTVWTWHDPWPITGHCVYPMSCKRFSKGCGECPDLHRAFSVGKDHTRFNREIKKELFKNGYTLHIASDWFANYVRENTGADFPLPEVLPFGLDSERFSGTNKSYSLKVSEKGQGKITIGIRAVREAQKNFELFRNALINIKNPERYRIVTLQETGMLAGLDPRIEVQEIGWTNSPDTLENFFKEIDVFVMPSLFETFGFMALEAMSSGVPVIGVGGTAVDEVCDLDATGFKITGHSSFELQTILSNLSILDNELSIKSRLGVKRVNENFELEKFCQNMKILYLKTIEEFKIAKNSNY